MALESALRRMALRAGVALLVSLPIVSQAQSSGSSGGTTTPVQPVANVGAPTPVDKNAASGQALGSSLYPTASGLATFDQNTGNITVPAAGGATINANQLFPGSAGGDGSQFTNLYQDNTAIQNATGSAVQQQQTTNTPVSQAWSVPATATSRTHPDLTNDPLWSQTDYVNANQQAIEQGFSDCSTTTVLSPTTTTSHIPDIKTCQRVSTMSGSDTLVHNYTIQPAMTLSGISGAQGNCLVNPDGTEDCTQFKDGTGTPFGIGDLPTQSCGADCIDLILGHAGDNFLSGTGGNAPGTPCTMFRYQVSVNLPVPGAISSVILTTAHWDDRQLILLNNAAIWDPSNGMQIPNGGACDQGVSNIQTPNVDVTSAFTANPSMNFTMYVQVGGGGEGWAILEIHYNKDALIQDNGWSSPGAIDLANVAAECPSGAISVTQSPSLDSNGCATFNNDLYCPSDFAPPPAAGVNSLITQASVSVNNCAANLGTGQCRVLADGSTYCPVNTPSNTTTNNCGQYSSNSACAYESTTCLQYDASNNCVAFEDTYDCGENVQVSNASTQTVLSCNGAIPCVGETCSTKGGDAANPTAYSQAVGALSVANAIHQDGNCDPSGNCTIFQGNEGTCHETVGGIVNDCCSGKTGASLKSFMDLSLSVMGDSSAQQRLTYEDPTYGAWNTLSGGGLFGQNTETQPVTSSTDNYTGATSQNTNGQSASTYQSNSTQAHTNYQESQVESQLGTQAASTMFTKNSGGGWSYTQAMQGGMEMASGLMAAYMTWETTLALLNYLAPCTKDEFQTVSKVHLKACHLIGPHCQVNILGACMESEEIYCCYATPLARIVSEQVYPQLGISYGSGDSPHCPAGISIDELNSVDWSKVDLSEYAGILQTTGHLPDPTAANNLTIQAMTGAGSRLDTDGTRPDAVSRASQRVYNLNAEANRQATDMSLWGNNPAPTQPVTGQAPAPTTGQ